MTVEADFGALGATRAQLSGSNADAAAADMPVALVGLHRAVAHASYAAVGRANSSTWGGVVRW